MWLYGVVLLEGYKGEGEKKPFQEGLMDFTQVSCDAGPAADHSPSPSPERPQGTHSCPEPGKLLTYCKQQDKGKTVPRRTVSLGRAVGRSNF